MRRRPFDRSKRMLDQLLSPLHVVRVAAEDELHPGILLFSPAKVVIGGILLYIRDLLERRFRIAVHVHRHIYRVVTDLHSLCISGISAAVGEVRQASLLL